METDTVICQEANVNATCPNATSCQELNTINDTISYPDTVVSVKACLPSNIVSRIGLLFFAFFKKLFGNSGSVYD